jgi:[ribosomal protein S5]-alanine N-acetyltransferase
MSKRMIIKTPRLHLRPYTYDDLDDYHALNADPRLLAYELHQPFRLNETKNYLAYWMNAAKDNDEQFGTYEMAIELIKEERVIGLFSTIYRDIGSSVLEIGMRLHYDYQHQGYATEALKAIIDEAFSSTDIHRIFGCTDARNTACIKVFEKIGMQREGYLRQSIRMPDDTYADEVVYAILRED